MPCESKTTLNIKKVAGPVERRNRRKKNMAEEKGAEVPAADVVVEKDALTLTQEKLAKAETDRDNYKAVALKRLGKLPGDAEFLDKEGDGELSVAEQVRIALLDREVEEAKKEEKVATDKLIRRNAELELALKNQPGASLGGSGSGTGPEVKDNVFSEAQLVALRQRAEKLKTDPEKFIEAAKANFIANKR